MKSVLLKRVLLSSISIVALTVASSAHAGTIVNYGAAGLSAGSPVSSATQMQNLYNQVIAAGKANGVISGNWVAPPLTYASGIGIDNMEYNTYSNGTNAIVIDMTNLSSKNLTASQDANVLAHEIYHCLYPDNVTTTGLSSEESQNANEAAADAGAIQITGGDSLSAVNAISSEIKDFMALNPGVTLDQANTDMSDADHGTPYQRAEASCFGCALPSNIVNADYQQAPGETIVDGKLVPIPLNEMVVDPPSNPLTVIEMNDQSNGLGNDGGAESVYDGGGVFDEYVGPGGSDPCGSPPHCGD